MRVYISKNAPKSLKILNFPLINISKKFPRIGKLYPKPPRFIIKTQIS